MIKSPTINAVRNAIGGKPLTGYPAINKAIKADRRYASSVYCKRYISQGE